MIGVDRCGPFFVVLSESVLNAFIAAIIHGLDVGGNVVNGLHQVRKLLGWNRTTPAPCPRLKDCVSYYFEAGIFLVLGFSHDVFALIRYQCQSRPHSKQALLRDAKQRAANRLVSPLLNACVNSGVSCFA